MAIKQPQPNRFKISKTTYQMWLLVHQCATAPTTKFRISVQLHGASHLHQVTCES